MHMTPAQQSHPWIDKPYRPLSFALLTGPVGLLEGEGHLVR